MGVRCRVTLLAGALVVSMFPHTRRGCLAARVPPPVEETNRCLNEISDGAGEPEAWEKDLCTRRYLWVFGFHLSGTGVVREVLAESPSVIDPLREGSEHEAQHGQSVYLTDHERGMLPQMCGYMPEEARYISWENCLYLCRYWTRQVISRHQRRALYQSWVARWAVGPEQAMVLKDPDFVVNFKLWLFPYVSDAVLVMRFPGCLKQPPGVWARIWVRFLRDEVKDLPGNVAVVRAEDALVHTEAMTRLLERHLGLGPETPRSDKLPAVSMRAAGGDVDGEIRAGGPGGYRKLFMHSTNISSEYLCGHSGGWGHWAGLEAIKSIVWTGEQAELLKAFEYPLTFVDLDTFAQNFQEPRVWTKDELVEMGQKDWVRNSPLGKNL